MRTFARTGYSRDSDENGCIVYPENLGKTIVRIVHLRSQMVSDCLHVVILCVCTYVRLDGTTTRSESPYKDLESGAFGYSATV